jgi:hypothetical protein
LFVAQPKFRPVHGKTEHICQLITSLVDTNQQPGLTKRSTALADLPRIGGSRAQREVFEGSLIVAYLRSGQFAKAAPLLRSRLARRPLARNEA